MDADNSANPCRGSVNRHRGALARKDALLQQGSETACDNRTEVAQFRSETMGRQKAAFGLA